MLKKNKKWKDFSEFIDFANLHCNWVVIRNFEYLPNNFFSNDTDVDLLCDDLNHFVDKMCLRKRSWGVSSYETFISGRLVFFDVRFIGDGYFDKLWQYKMLKNKVYTSENVPRMNDEDYFFSLLYHIKIHKRKITYKYNDRLNDLSELLNINISLKNLDFKEAKLAKVISLYMLKNNYKFTYPVDKSILINSSFVKLLDFKVRKNKIFYPPFHVSVIKLIPSCLKNLTPITFKNFIKNLLDGIK